MILKTKKAFFLPLIILLVVIFSNAWGTEVYIQPVKIHQGQIVTARIMVDQVDNLAGIKLVMKYDPGILAYKNDLKSKQTSSLMHIINSKIPGKLIIVMAGATGIQGKEIPLIDLFFLLKENIDKKELKTSIDITEIQLMSDKLVNLASTTKNGDVIILPDPVTNTAK